MSGTTPAVRQWYPRRPDRLGCLLGPGRAFVRSMLDTELPFAADNGCFVGLDRRAFLRMLADLAAHGRGGAGLFVTAPDVVADAAETLRRFRVWGPLIREVGLKVALVGQDGLTAAQVPWDDLDAYFVGGSDAWKLCPDSQRLARQASQYGKHLHMGRVNSLRRIRVAAAWGCDSIDGTGFTWFSDVRIPRAINWIDRALFEAQHPGLFRQDC